jgi:hypothetical protein
MKKKMFLCWIIGLVFQACVKTDDFETPKLDIPEVLIDGHKTSIDAVKGNFNFQTEEIYTFNNTNTWVEGYVISSDEGGNFYKELILQDKPVDPTAGIQILLDKNSLYLTYDIGRMVFIKLDGLSLGFNNGVLQLGIQNRGDVVAIPNSMIEDHVKRSEIKEEIVPLQLRIEDFSPEHRNIFVQLENVQFDPNLVREANRFSFASNVVDRYDGQRQIISCENGATTMMSTSTFSDFKSLLLPMGSGSVQGILTRDFYDDQYVIIVNSPDALKMNGERCDPEYLECNMIVTEGSNLLLEENFDGVTSNTTLNSRGWTNVNVSGGEKKFTPTLSSGNRILRISAYNTNESPLEAWLVTPPVQLDTSTNEYLNFDILSSYDNGMLLEVYITTDFTGTPATTNWVRLDANIPLGPSRANSSIYKNSKIDISCLEGKVWVGFRYFGSAPDKTTTYDLDNIRIIGE